MELNDRSRMRAEILCTDRCVSHSGNSRYRIHRRYSERSLAVNKGGTAIYSPFAYERMQRAYFYVSNEPESRAGNKRKEYL